jgi:hypothetical protein
VLEQRVSMNEESVSSVLDYFREVKEQKLAAEHEVLQFNHATLAQQLFA